MTREQTEALKQRYMQQMLATAGPATGPKTALTVSNVSAPNVPSTSVNATSGFSLASLPTDLLRGVNLSEISPQVLQDLAAGRVPDLGLIPPNVVQTLINRRPDLFGQMVDKLLQNKIDAVGLTNSILGKLPPIQQAPIPVTGAPYDVNELDYKGDLGYFNQMKGNQNNMGLWTGLGLGVVGLITLATVLFLCFKRRRSRRTEENEGTKLFSTPRSSTATILPVSNNNNLPQFFDPPSHMRATLDYSKSALDYSKPGVEYCKSSQDYSKPGLDYSKSGVEYCKSSQDYSKPGLDYSKSDAEYCKSSHDYSKTGLDYSKSPHDYSKPSYSNAAYCKAYDSSPGYSNPEYSKPGAGDPKSDSWIFSSSSSPNYKKTEM